MILDKKSEFSDKQAMTVAVGTVNSTKAIDTGAAVADAGIGNVPFVYVNADTPLTSGGAATVDVQVQTSDAADFSVSPRTISLFGPVPFAELRKLAVKLPRRLRRYVRLQYVVAGAALTGGTVSAGLALDVSLSSEPAASSRCTVRAEAREVKKSTFTSPPMRWQ